MVNRVFALFDADNNGVVDIKEFALGMSMLVKGSKEQKLRMAFDVLDADGSGHVSREELLQYFQSLRDVFRESSGISPVGDTDEELIAAVEECFAVADIDGNGAISWDGTPIFSPPFFFPSNVCLFLFFVAFDCSGLCMNWLE